MEPINTEIVVVGGGPGGLYRRVFMPPTSAKKSHSSERDKRLGGVCLNRGCIPSKALLYATHAISESRESAHRGGIVFRAAQGGRHSSCARGRIPSFQKLCGGILMLAGKRDVQVIHGRGYFEGSQTLRVEREHGQQFINFEQAIIATGSKSAMPKAFDLGNPRIMTSREALDVEDVPENLLVVGGGYIGMELGTVYATLGSKVVMVEALDSILLGADPDLARPVMAYARKAFKEVRLKSKVLNEDVHQRPSRSKWRLRRRDRRRRRWPNRVLVAVGRVPNAEDLGLENTKVARDEKGFVKVDANQRTADESIYAVGDIAGGILLAHKAFREARIAVDAINGEAAPARRIYCSAVVFTDPEVAWCGLTEVEAKEKGIEVEVAKFPWGASGRALTFDRTDGLTKLIIDPKTERVLGVGIVGHGAGELIAEGVVAVEMGATVRDLALCVHPHPTLSETIMEAAEVFFGHATHTLSKKRPE